MSLRMILATVMLSLVAHPAAQAQTGTISGIVVDDATSLPLPFVNIMLHGTSRGVSSKLDGTFEIKGVQKGITILVLSAVGYERDTAKILVQPNAISSVSLRLRDALQQMEEVQVRADRPVSSASSQFLQALDFELRPQNSAQDLLRLVPGLVIAQHAGGGKAEQIFLRGFDADHGADVNISIDGIPVNMVSHGHGQGYADLHFVMPEVLSGMEVYKGPYFAQFGDFGTAGTVALTTMDRPEQDILKVEVGSFGLKRVFAMSDIPVGHERTRSYVVGELVSQRSFFEQSQNFRRANLFGKLTRDLGGGENISLWISGFGSRWDASGQIPERGVQEGLISRFGSFDPSEGGETSRSNLHFSYSRVNETSRLVARAYASQYRFKLFSNFTYYKDDPINGDQIEQIDRRWLFGAKMDLTTNGLVGSRNISTTLGWSFRRDDITTDLWHDVRRERLEQRASNRILQWNLSTYLQQEYLVAEMLRIVTGLRAD